MTPERLRKIEELYSAARKDRGVLDKADPELRLEVESMLAHEEDGSVTRTISSAKHHNNNSNTAGVTPGSQLGPYLIEESLGAGGMGQVFRARDTRLGRMVAIKLIREEFLLRRDFQMRFEREARATAALNHPHICALYDVGPNYLVMELVEGETLAARLQRAKLSLEQTLQFGQQIAAGMAAAHGRGITHRDLKPGNVMLSKSGVKILDFGLAKSTQDETLTATDLAVGTPAYMAPEQSEGKDCDARTDIYSLGLILYEMATGKRRSAEGAPAGNSLQPEKLEHLIERCLERNPEDRWQSASDIRKELEWVAKSASVAPVSPRKKGVWVWIAAGLIAAAAAAIAGIIWFRPTASRRDPVRFTFTTPPEDNMNREIAMVSPDGRSVAFTARNASGQNFVWVRSLDASTARRLEGTEQAYMLFWSADGQFIAYFTSNKLKKIPLSGGPPQTICTTTPGLGGTWNLSGDIVFNPINRAALMHVSAAGGTPQQITTLNEERQENSHRWPSFLPDGRHFLFTVRSSLKENTGIYVGSLDSKETKRILTEQSNAFFSPPGYLLFARDGAIMAQRFDLGKLQVTGEAVPVVAGIDAETSSAEGYFSVSADGNTLAYSELARPIDQLTWFDRTGTQTEPFGPLGRYLQARISPDGKRLAYASIDAESGNRDIWLMNIATGIRTRFTSHPATDWFPLWSPDGSDIAFASDRTPHSSIFHKPADASREEESLFIPQGKGGAFPTSWSPDGKMLAYHLDNPEKRTQELWFLPVSGDRKPQPFLTSEFVENSPAFSPDGKLVAYASGESGTLEVYVRAIGKPDKIRVSTNVGSNPVWRKDGRELFYEAPGVTIMASDVQSSEPLRISPPKLLFHACSAEGASFVFPDYDVSRDGKRFLFSCFAQATNRRALSVAIGWEQMVKWPDGAGARP